MLATHVDDVIASGAALFGAACLVSWPFFKRRRTMLLIQIGIGAGFGVHYALLGASTAAVANLLSALQIAASLQVSATSRWINYLLIPSMVLTCALTYAGLSSLCAMLGTVLLAVGRMQVIERKLRMWVMLGTIPWLLHDLLVASPIAVIDAISIVTGGYGYWKSSTPASKTSCTGGLQGNP